MTDSTDERALFEDAIDVPLWLEADRDTPLAARVDRDRALAGRVPDEAASDLVRVRTWWASLRPGDALGAGLQRGRRLVSAALLVLGIASGGAVAAAALHYDGSLPVNIVRAFALLVGLQVLVLLFTLALLPGGRFGLRGLQSALVALNPAAIAAAAYRRFARLPESVERLFIWHGGRSSANRFAKWQLLFWAQLTAVGFNVGALATSFALVAVTDLAFGWSTTLTVEPHDVAVVTDAISMPWAAWLPRAVPSYSLIEGSRFFRLEHVAVAAREAQAFTGWWPFLLAAIVAYGLVPRLALCVFAARRLEAATRSLLLEDSRVTALLDRMQSPSVRLAAAGAEAARDVSADVAPGAPAESGTVAAVIWADSIEPSAVEGTVVDLWSARLAGAALPAGGGRSLAHDRATADRVAALGARRIAIFTRAYEPPLLDVLDFLGVLRGKLGATVSIVVCPMPEAGGSVTPDDLDAWRRTLATLHDARLYVEALG